MLARPSQLLKRRTLQHWRWFSLPKSYKPAKAIPKIPFSELTRIWLNSFRPNRLQELQDQLLSTMLPPEFEENAGIEVKNERVSIDNEGNYINEVSFTVENHPEKPFKHIVFIHGYGASLGCFSRNFQMVNQLKGLEHNYKVHFLDNISFGLSSNPKIKDTLIDYWKIAKCPSIQIKDSKPNDTKTLYNKYYKLVDSFDINEAEFTQYKDTYGPIMRSIENYYLSALDGWRKNSGISAIDFLIGHSYGGYWSGSYTVKSPEKVNHLILLSPVGVERSVYAISNPGVFPPNAKPTLDPTEYNFLSRVPILPKNHFTKWYHLQPFLPRFLRYLGPWGVRKYRAMWYMKLFKINKIIDRFGGPENVFKSNNDLIYGSNKECNLIIEYLYNSITTGTVSDIYSKNMLTPSTTSKVPLYDKFYNFVEQQQFPKHFKLDVIYGQFDFMNSEAGSKLVDHLAAGNVNASLHKIREGGHNLYIDNPFDTNNLVASIVKQSETAESQPKLANCD